MKFDLMIVFVLSFISYETNEAYPVRNDPDFKMLNEMIVKKDKSIDSSSSSLPIAKNTNDEFKTRQVKLSSHPTNKKVKSKNRRPNININNKNENKNFEAEKNDDSSSKKSINDITPAVTPVVKMTTHKKDPTTLNLYYRRDEDGDHNDDYDDYYDDKNNNNNNHQNHHYYPMPNYRMPPKQLPPPPYYQHRPIYPPAYQPPVYNGYNNDNYMPLSMIRTLKSNRPPISSSSSSYYTPSYQPNSFMRSPQPLNNEMRITNIPIETYLNYPKPNHQSLPKFTSTGYDLIEQHRLSSIGDNNNNNIDDIIPSKYVPQSINNTIKLAKKILHGKRQKNTITDHDSTNTPLNQEANNSTPSSSS